MDGYTESQKKIITTAHTVVAFIVVLAFIAAAVWVLLMAMSLASPILVPVAIAFFLALFFKPYYLWLEKRLRIRSVAVIVMLLTVLLPIVLLVWWAGATIVDEITNLIRQIPNAFSRLFAWVESSFPRVNDLLSQVTASCASLTDHVATHAGNAVSAGASAVAANGVEISEFCANYGMPATNAAMDAVSCESVTGVVSNALSANSNVAEVVQATCSAQPTNSSLGGLNIDAEKLKELYATYGDSIKKTGANLFHAGYDKLSGAFSGGGASAHSAGAAATAAAEAGASGAGKSAAAASGSVFGKIGLAWASFCTALSAVGSGAMGLLRGVLYVLVTTIFFVYFLLTKNCRGGQIAEGLPLVKDKTKKFIAKQIDAIIDIMVSFYQRQVLICLIEGCLYGLGFWIVGVPYGFIIGFLLGVINLVPFMGTVVCLPIALVLAYFGAGGSGVRLILALLVWGLGQFLDGYFITPKIQGDKTGLGYVGVIFSFFLWGAILGPVLGLLLAIPLSACCVVVWRAVRDWTKTTRIF